MEVKLVLPTDTGPLPPPFPGAGAGPGPAAGETLSCVFPSAGLTVQIPDTQTPSLASFGGFMSLTVSQIVDLVIKKKSRKKWELFTHRMVL